MTDSGPTDAGVAVVLIVRDGADEDAARRLATEGRALVLVGDDGTALGSLAAELHGLGARVAVVHGEPDAPEVRDAATAMSEELFGSTA